MFGDFSLPRGGVGYLEGSIEGNRIFFRGLDLDSDFYYRIKAVVISSGTNSVHQLIFNGDTDVGNYSRARVSSGTVYGDNYVVDGGAGAVGASIAVTLDITKLPGAWPVAQTKAVVATSSGVTWVYDGADVMRKNAENITSIQIATAGIRSARAALWKMLKNRGRG